MANDLDQDPLVIDTTATDIKCARIEGVALDTGDGTGSASIVDGTTGHLLWSASFNVPFADLHLSLPRPADGSAPVIDVTISGGATLRIYKGSGPR